MERLNYFVLSALLALCASHFLFAEKNNVQFAGMLSDWLTEKGLDG